jgi:aminoglycoside N3'-acetyltransferase
MHALETLTRDLAGLGVTTGDVLMVHASLRAVGVVEDGADGTTGALVRFGIAWMERNL